MKKLAEQIRENIVQRRKNRRLTTALTAIAGILVFITVYTLVLPAFALQDEANCGKEVHEHTDACYSSVLDCDKVEHTHDDGCYDEEGNLICDKEEHTHDDNCYKKELTCGKEKHVHTAACYKKTVDETADTVSEDAQEIKTAESSDKKADSHSTAAENAKKKKDTDKASDDTEKAEKAEDTSEDAAEALEPVDLSQYLTEDTGLWYYRSSDKEKADWNKVKRDTELQEKDLVSVHLAFQFKKGTVKEDMGETIYELPDSIEFTDVIAKWLNDDNHGMNQMILGKATPDNPSKSKDSYAGKYTVSHNEETDKWELTVEWDDEMIARNAKKTVNVWADMYITGKALKPMNNGTGKVIFTKKNINNKKIAALFAGIVDEDGNPEGVETGLEHSGEISLADYMTKDTGLWYYRPSNKETASWNIVRENTTLKEKDLVCLHLAFLFKEGTINTETYETTYELPDNIEFTDVIASWLNDANHGMNQITMGKATPDNPVKDEDSLAGTYTIAQNEETGAWEMIVTWEPRMIGQCLIRDVDAWTDLYLTGKAINPLDDGSNTVIFSYRNQDGKEISTTYAGMEKEAGSEDEDVQEDIMDQGTTSSQEESSREIYTTDINNEASTEGAEADTGAAETATQAAPGAATAADGQETATQAESAPEATTEAGAADAAATDATGAPEAATQAAPADEYSEGTLTYTGKDYTVTATYGADAKLPAGVKLDVREIREDSSDKTEQKEFQDYLKQAESAVKEGNGTVTGARFFDITFTDGTKELEPAAPVSVKIEYKKAEKLENNEDVVAVHLPEKADNEVLNDVEVQKTGDAVKEVEFTAENFSVYGVIYTVDYYINGYEFHMPGSGTIKLSELFRQLEINEDVHNVEKVEFTDDSLLKITADWHLGFVGSYDWTIESLQPFTSWEKLTITMKDGRIIEIDVTDAMESDGVWNLADSSNTQFFHVSVDSSVTQNEQERDAAFKLNFTFSLEESVVKAIDNYNKEFSLVYDLNSFVANSPIGNIRNNTNGVISIGSRKLGTYTVIDNVVKMTFTDPAFFDGRTAFTGGFSLTAETSESELGNQDEYTYEFPGTTDTIPIHYKKTVENGSKSVYSTKNEDGSYTLHYTANINVNTDLDSMVFNDTLSGLQTLDASSVKIAGKTVSVNQNGQNFSFDVASALGTTGVAKGYYQVTYDTKVTEAQLLAMSADKTTEKNKATWRVNGNRDVPGGETSIDLDKPREPIPVTKNISSTSNKPGDTVTYTVTYGKNTTDLAGFHISDYMTDVVIPQGKVTLSFNGQTKEIDFDAQAKDTNYSKGTVTLFDYTFPDNTTGNGPVTATYTVKLIDKNTATANGIYDATDVANTAQEHRQNTTDTKKTTVTYEKEPHFTVDKTVSANPDGDQWLPGTVLTYTLTVGDSATNMAGVNIKDTMTDQQILQGDIMIKVGNGSQMKLSDYVSGAIKWSDDGQYSDNRVDLFNFNMPSNAGNGPVVITYQTRVISQNQATASGLYGEHRIENTGSGGGDNDSTSHPAKFDDFPISKSVTQNSTDVNGQTVNVGSTVHYTLTYGEAGMKLAGALIEDYMTDIQKLVSPITITKKDGTSFVMPNGTGQWSEDGNNWDFWDDGKYDANNKICLFKYRLPNNIGEGPITIEYDAQIINEDEAKESGITDTRSAFNEFRHDGITPTTEIKIEFPKEVSHNPQVRKEFDHWDVDNGRVYWNIIVEKDNESAYPIKDVTVRESTDQSHVVFKSESQGIWYYAAKASDFDMIHAVVTTDDGTVLTPGVDYSIDKDNALFGFPLLKERVHINLSFKTDNKIIDGTYMKNEVRLNNGNTAEAEATYNSPDLNMIKYGKYSESDRLLEWEVLINPTKKAFNDSDPVRVWFSDAIPKGLSLVNYTTKSTDNPSIFVSYEGDQLSGKTQEFTVNVNSETNVIEAVDIAAHNPWNPNSNQHYGLNREKIVVKYYTKLSDGEWDRITSSASGSEEYQNNATITAGDNETLEATDTVTVTSDEYINKTDTTKESGGLVVDPDSNENSKNITYSVEINPNGNVLNSRNTLTLTDYIDTNMDLDTTSVLISDATKGSDGKLVAGETTPVGLEVSYNDDSRLLSIRNIPDSTPLLLTYSCIARAQGQDTFKNTATLIGGGSHSSSTNEKHTVQTDAAWIKVDGITMSMHKIDENNISKKLSGAKFQLYECELAIGDLTNSDTYPQSWWNDLLNKVDQRSAGNASTEDINYIDSNFKIVNYKEVGAPVVTGEKGYTQWDGLNEHKLYAWKEIEAPEGYTCNDSYHYFVGYQHIDVNSDVLPQPLLNDTEQTNRKKAAWALDDATQFANGIRVASMANLTTWTATNVQTEYTSITASKTWENDSDNLFETRPKGGIKLQLWKINADGSKEKVGSTVAINADKDGNWPSYIWNKLPTKDGNGNDLKYTVTEERVENYSTSYSDSGNGQTSGEIIVTNRMIPKSTNISVKKVFDIPDGDDKPSQIKVGLWVIKTDKEGNSGEPEEMNMETYLNDMNNWSYTFEKLPTTQVIDGKPYFLTYTVKEDLNALANQGFRYTVTYSDNNQGIVENTVDNPLVITNTKVVGSVKVTKSFSGIDSLPDNFKITATYNDGESHSVNLTTSSEGMTGTGTAADPYTWIIDNLELGTVVTFTESGYNVDGYNVKVNGSASAAELTATAAETPGQADFVNEYEDNHGSLSVIKAVTEGIDAGNTVFTFKIALTGQIDTSKLKLNGADIPADKVTTVNSNKTEITVEITGTGEAKLEGIPMGTVYEVTEPVGNMPIGWMQSGEIRYSDETTKIQGSDNDTATVTNTNTSFEFVKEWHGRQSTEIEAWPDKEITVTVNRENQTGTPYSNFGLTYKIKKSDLVNGKEIEAETGSAVPEGEAIPKLKVVLESTSEDNVPTYKFKISGIKVGESEDEIYKYVVQETGVPEDYTESYVYIGADSAGDGGKIINTPKDAVELPNTGGIGTDIFRFAGIMLIALGTVLYGIRTIRRRRQV